MPEIIVKLGENVVHKHFLYKDVISIGRSADNEIPIENLAVSRKHAVVKRTEGNYLIEDLDSANGTYVNGVRVSKTEILDRDIITIGKHELHFYNQQSEAAPAIDYAQQTMLVDHSPSINASLRVVQGKQKDDVFKLEGAETRIGRASDNDIRLNDWFVSKHHAVIVRRGLVYVVRDLASWRHTLVNGSVIEEQSLKAGDKIQFGPKITVIFEIAEAKIGGGGAPRKPVELAEDVKNVVAQEEASPEPIASEVVRADSPDEVPGDLPAVEPQPARAEELEADVPAEFDSEDDELDALSQSTPFEAETDPAVWGEDESSNAQPWAPEPASTGEREPESETAEPWSDDEASTELAEGEREPNETVDSPDPVDEADPGIVIDPAEAVANEMTSVASELSGADSKEVSMWLRALKNPSRIIRKQARRKLKALTGRDYDIE